MVTLKCANCGETTELSLMPKKFVCPVCGVLNTPQSENAGTGDEACGCILPTGFEWKLPVGVFETPSGKLYATADDGTKLTKAEWIAAFGSDPDILKEWMTKMGKEGADGFKNLSTLRQKA